MLLVLVGGGVGIGLATAGGKPEPVSAPATSNTDPPTPPADAATPDVTEPPGAATDDDSATSDDDASDDDDEDASDDEDADEDADDEDADDEDASDSDDEDAYDDDDEDASDSDDATDDDSSSDADKDCRTTKYIPTEAMAFEQDGDRVRIWRDYSYGWRINYRVNGGETYYVDVQKQLLKGNTPGIYGTDVDDGDFTVSVVSKLGTGIWNGEVTLTQTKFKMVLNVCGDWEYVEGFTNVW
ncbi:hypothetical protein ACQPZX_39610 [Actinoplanes sp. CA-142083]|uniref:hypothetical protein n=1 Tax=Actinoplanes sp. CA-142083 TaxID=3239903 RepID=UPI003D8B4B21